MIVGTTTTGMGADWSPLGGMRGYQTEGKLMTETDWLLANSTGDVRGFFAHIGVDLPDRTGADVMMSCFTNHVAHRRDDRDPSCSVNVLTGLWNCKGCGQRGNAYQAALSRGYGEREAVSLTRRFGLFRERDVEAPKPRLPTERQVRKWVDALSSSAVLLKRLFELKGWTPQAIRRLQLGWDGERLTFPIRNAKLKLIGLVRYLPGGRPKTLALPGSKRSLFPAPEAVPRRMPLFLVEGEGDAVAVWSTGHRAVAVPGAGSWRREWVQRLSGRKLIVLADCDPPGRLLAAQIAGEALDVRVVDVEPGRSDGFDVGSLVVGAAGEGGLWQMSRWLRRLT